MRRSISHLLSFLASGCLLASSAQAENQTQSTEYSLEDLSCTLSELGTFCLKRVPNQQELFADIGVVTPIDLTITYLGLDLGDDPVSKSVIRDATKIISLVYKVATDTKVGSTDFKFDSSNLYSQVVKTGTKVAGIAAGVSPDLVNFPGDVLARFFVKAGMEKQKDSGSEDQAFHVYFYEKFNPLWMAQSFSEILPKSSVMMVIGKLIVKSRIQSIEKLPFLIPNWMMGGTLTVSRSIVAMGQNAAILNGRMPVFMAYPTAILMGGTSALLRGITESFILSTAARITMDGVAAVRESDLVHSYYVWFFPATEEQGKIDL